MERAFNVFSWAMIIIVAMTGCNKDNGENGKGKGVLKIKGNEYSITEANMYVGLTSPISSFYGRHLYFFNEEGKMAIQVTMSDSGFTSKTYTNDNTYMALGLFVDDEPESDIDNVVMVVKKIGNTYDIIITGKTQEKGCEYALTYKGIIAEGKHK